MELSEKDEEYIISLVKEGKKIDAIVFVKDKTGMTLKESKDYTDKLILEKNIETNKESTCKWGCVYDEKLNAFIPNLARQEFEKIELSDKFEIKSLRTNIWWLFLYIIFFIILIFIFSSLINILLKELTYKHIFYTIFFIGVIIFNCYNFLRELKARKYFLTISGKTIKIYFENSQKEVITTDNISQVKFYVIDTGRGIGKKNPTLQIFDSEEKKLVEMTIKTIDYYSLKKYFEKYNVTIDNQYKEF